MNLFADTKRVMQRNALQYAASGNWVAARGVSVKGDIVIRASTALSENKIVGIDLLDCELTEDVIGPSEAAISGKYGCIAGENIRRALEALA
jgi:hypothetical protein